MEKMSIEFKGKIFRKIHGYENYFVSSCGDVLSLANREKNLKFCNRCLPMKAMRMYISITQVVLRKFIYITQFYMLGLVTGRKDMKGDILMMTTRIMITEILLGELTNKI